MKRILVLVSTLCLTGTLTGNVAAAGQGHGAGTAPSTVKSPQTPIKYSHPARVSPRSPSTLTRPVMVKVLAAHAARPGTQAVAHVPRVTALGIKAMPRTGGGSVLNAPALPALPMLPMLPTLPTLARLALLALGGVIRKLNMMSR